MQPIEEEMEEINPEHSPSPPAGTISLQSLEKKTTKKKSEDDPVRLMKGRNSTDSYITMTTLNSNNTMMTSHSLRQQGNSCRFRKIKFTILRTQFCNHLAYKYYSKRQMVFSYLPLQILAMLSAILGFLGSSKGSSDDDADYKEEGTINPAFFIEGIIGTMMIFFINLSKNLNYDAKAKQHELVASQMKWLIDDLDGLEYTCFPLGVDDYSDDNINIRTDDEYDAIKKGFAKVESDFFSSTQTLQTVLPDEIGLAFSKLKFELKLLRANTNNVYHNDDLLYNRVVEFAYSELAVILGGRILYLPTPEDSVKMTLERVSTLLPSTVVDQIKLR